MAPPLQSRVHGLQAQSTGSSRAARIDPPLTALPAFPLADAGGRPVASSSLQPTRAHGHWLLVYTGESCPGCDAVLSALAGSTNPRFHEAGRVAVVVRPRDAKDLPTAMASAHTTGSTLGNATWTSDPDGSAAAALKLKTAPVILLMEGSKVREEIPGTLGDPGKVAGAASAWLTRDAPLSSTSNSSEAQTSATPSAIPTTASKDASH